MPKISEELRSPPHSNGSAAPGHQGGGTAPEDRRLVYYIIGGLLLAFAIGFSFLVYALSLDWQH
ncbi:MAG: hypothetical protein JWQ98_1843 [Chlorobi bacterium]|nr:hypothetical protein [Chlorobiota bacterium]